MARPEQVRHCPLNFFDGEVLAHGMVLDRSERVRRAFSAVFRGVRDGAVVTVSEVLTYHDQGQDLRDWRIVRIEDGLYTAEATGLVAPARLVMQSHNQCNWRYQMDVPIGGRSLRFDLEDIMVQLSEDVMVSHTPMRKFGITWAMITTTYCRV